MQLYNGDCLEILKDIPDKSIDLILTDPPYGTTQCKWDSIIPFEKMWPELERIIKDNGAILLFGSEPFSSALRMSNINHFKYDWIWDKNKGNNFLDSHCRPNKIHEIISVFSKSGCSNGAAKKMNYNPQGLIKSDKIMRRGNTGKLLNSCKYNEYKQEYTNYPKTILHFSVYNKNHPCEKPVDLLEYLIKTYTSLGNTVLDFTMGSGSTGVAAVNTGRDFIGIELDKNYFEIAKKRILENQSKEFEAETQTEIQHEKVMCKYTQGELF